MDSSSSHQWRVWCSRLTDDGLSPAKAIPFHNLILTHRLEVVFDGVLSQTPGLLLFHFLSRHGESSDQGRGAANGICFGFCFWLFDFGDFSNLIKITFEDGGIWDIFGGFGHLQENDTGADLQEAHDDSGDGKGGAFETSEEDGRRDDGCGGEEDVIGGGDEGSIEEVEGFLVDVRFEEMEYWRATYIQVDDLGQKGSDNKDQQDIEEPLVELSLTASLSHHSAP